MSALITCIVSFLILDSIWLGWLAKNLYHQSLSSIMRLSADGGMAPNWIAAIIVYAALVAGILIFAVPKAQGNWWMALLWGGLFGLISYGIYDFTNLAVLAAWQWKIAIIDTLWGMVLCGLTGFFTVWVGVKLSW